VIGLVDADSSIPNLALMRLAAYLTARGETVRLIRPKERPNLWNGFPSHIYGSSIFTHAAKVRGSIERLWGPVRWGGTGVNLASNLCEIDSSVEWDRVTPDYGLYPDFAASLGFLTRGCIQTCPFCVVPEKEGRPVVVSSVREVWRGEGHPRHLMLLDNDAFTKSLRDFWRGVVAEVCAGDFRVCFNQGINLRRLDEEAAALIAATPYYATDFEHRTLYTAWDNLGDEKVFRRGVKLLADAGVPSNRLFVYMLVGYDPRETWDAIFYRFAELVALGCDPYPMPYNRSARPDLRAFERWAKRHYYRNVPWIEYRGRKGIPADMRAASDAAWCRVRGAHAGEGLS